MDASLSAVDFGVVPCDDYDPDTNETPYSQIGYMGVFVGGIYNSPAEPNNPIGFIWPATPNSSQLSFKF